ncbi:MAG: hypothetical protein NTX25_16760 [Proteobacteria bacterium]|nr:hypothetical protein [Pseudomonadota bacterium]
MHKRGTLLFLSSLSAAIAPKISAQTSAASADLLKMHGYGDIVFSFADYGEDPTAVELEYEESGEYEVEVEKGGEVQLEEFFIEHKAENQRLRIGRIPLAFGLLPLYHQPFDYLGTIRPESEEHLIPSAWSEIGAEYMTQGSRQMLQLQVVNGLDSTGFSSQYFVKAGQQTKFETVKSNNPAAVLRWTNYNIPGLEAGLSYYYGESSANRPQADLIKTCKGETNSERVAPCGYQNTPLQMASLFARGRWGSLQSQTSVVWGQVEHADAINRRNAALPKSLGGVLRTPVAEQAFAAWTEWGYVFDGFEDGDTLTPFFRLENFDTVWKAAKGQIDQARFDRRILALGLNYQLESSLYFKLDVMERRFGMASLRPEHELRFALGFVY